MAHVNLAWRKYTIALCLMKKNREKKQCMQSKHLKYENMHTNVTLYYSVQGRLDPVTPRNHSLFLLTVRLRLQAAKSQIRHKWFF